MKRLLISACVAGLAISGVSVRAAETTSEPTETSAPAAAANSSAIKSSHLKTASTKAGKPAKTKVPLPAPKPAEPEAADADARPELQAEATPADMQATEQPAADAAPEVRPDAVEQAAEAKPDDKKPSYMRTGHPEIDALVATHARANNVPEALVHRVIVRESKYQKDLVGSCGCIGLMQIKLGTARGLGYNGDAKGLHDPNTNLTYGVKYLAGAYRAANGNHDRAVQYFAKGYYEVAKRQRLADAQPFVKPERVHAPLDIVPRPAGAIHTAKHASRATFDKQATASR